MAISLNDLKNNCRLKNPALITKHQPKNVAKPWQDVITQNNNQKSFQQNHNQDADGKPDTKSAQTRHKVDTQVDTNPTQSQHKPDTINIEKVPFYDKVDTQVDTIKQGNPTQSRHTSRHNKTNLISLSSLSGIQRTIVVFLFRECQKTNGRIDEFTGRVTEPITPEYFSISCNINKLSISTTIKRMEKKKILERLKNFLGRHSRTIYRLSEHIFQEIWEQERLILSCTNPTQTRHKPDTKSTHKSTHKSTQLSLVVVTTYVLI